MKKRVCVVCETPYQLFSAIKFFVKQDEFKSDDIDLFLCNRDIAYDQIERIKQLKIAKNVYTFSNTISEFKQMNKPSIRLERFLFPKKFIARRLIESEIPEYHSYGYLICAFPISLVISLVMINPNVSIRIMDDGIGTYLGGIPNPNSIKKDIVFAIRGKKSPWRQIEQIYLNNPTFFTRNNSFEVIDLRLDDEKQTVFYNVVEYIFSYSNSELYDSKRYIYFTQPFSIMNGDFDSNQNTEKQILQTMKSKKKDCMIRTHPKQKDYSYNEIPKDEDNDLWEIICYKQITDEHVLIGTYSTAQFTPKIIYDIEPTIIFTFELFNNLFDKDKKKEMHRMIEKLRDTYSEKDKIVIVKNMEELSAVL